MPALFIVIELAVFVAAEGANALAIAPVPVANRIATGLAIAAFSALGFVVPANPRARTMLLALDAVFLGALAAFSAVAVAVTILLPMRCLELKPRDRAAFVACVAFGLFVFGVSAFVGIRIEHRPAVTAALAVLLPLYALALSLVVMANDLRLSRASLAAVNAELALRAERWEEIVTLSERYRIGRDLEDEVGPGLKEISNQLERALQVGKADPQGATASIFHAQRAAAFTLAALRRAVAHLRADSIGRGGLAAGLRDLCQAFSTAARLAITAEIDDVPVDDPLAAACIEQIAREALINVARHSGASTVSVFYGLREEAIELSVRDDGVGFDPAVTKAGHGLQLMRERAALVRATCAIESAPSRGTRVTLTLLPAKLANVV